MIYMYLYLCSQTPTQLKHPVPMEQLPVNKGSGQGYGFVVYRTAVSEKEKTVVITQLKDFGVVS